MERWRNKMRHREKLRQDMREKEREREKKLKKYEKEKKKEKEKDTVEVNENLFLENLDRCSLHSKSERSVLTLKTGPFQSVK